MIQRLAAVGVDADAYEADLTDPTAIVNVLEAAERRCGPVDVLVNNGATRSADTFVPRGKPGRNRFLELWTEIGTPLSAESSVRQFVGNAVAPAVLTREFARRHAARQASWGRIINISTDGSDGFPGEISYGARKFALERLTRSAAPELGQFGITANVLALGRSKRDGSRQHSSARSCGRFRSGASVRQRMLPTWWCFSRQTRRDG